MRFSVRYFSFRKIESRNVASVPVNASRNEVLSFSQQLERCNPNILYILSPTLSSHGSKKNTFGPCSSLRITMRAILHFRNKSKKTGGRGYWPTDFLSIPNPRTYFLAILSTTITCVVFMLKIPSHYYYLWRSYGICLFCSFYRSSS